MGLGKIVWERLNFTWREPGRGLWLLDDGSKEEAVKARLLEGVRLHPSEIYLELLEEDKKMAKERRERMRTGDADRATQQNTMGHK